MKENAPAGEPLLISLKLIAAGTCVFVALGFWKKQKKKDNRNSIVSLTKLTTI